eukprot:Skav215092  [mRNA]  locus=scaffold1068:106539:117364:- [translate_table: standard]
MSMLPASEAHMRTVQPWSSFTSMEAPSWIKSSMVSNSSFSAAFISAVTPSSSLTSKILCRSKRMFFCASAEPPIIVVPLFLRCISWESMRNLMTSVWPLLQAFIKDVSPVSSLAEILAPDSTRNFTTW